MPDTMTNDVPALTSRIRELEDLLHETVLARVLAGDWEETQPLKRRKVTPAAEDSENIQPSSQPLSQRVSSPHRLQSDSRDPSLPPHSPRHSQTPLTPNSARRNQIQFAPDTISLQDLKILREGLEYLRKRVRGEPIDPTWERATFTVLEQRYSELSGTMQRLDMDIQEMVESFRRMEKGHQEESADPTNEVKLHLDAQVEVAKEMQQFAQRILGMANSFPRAALDGAIRNSSTPNLPPQVRCDPAPPPSIPLSEFNLGNLMLAVESMRHQLNTVMASNTGGDNQDLATISSAARSAATLASDLEHRSTQLRVADLERQLQAAHHAVEMRNVRLAELARMETKACKHAAEALERCGLLESQLEESKVEAENNRKALSLVEEERDSYRHGLNEERETLSHLKSELQKQISEALSDAERAALDAQSRVGTLKEVERGLREELRGMVEGLTTTQQKCLRLTDECEILKAQRLEVERDATEELQRKLEQTEVERAEAYRLLGELRKQEEETATEKMALQSMNATLVKERDGFCDSLQAESQKVTETSKVLDNLLKTLEQELAESTARVEEIERLHATYREAAKAKEKLEVEVTELKLREGHFGSLKRDLDDAVRSRDQCLSTIGALESSVTHSKEEAMRLLQEVDQEKVESRQLRERLRDTVAERDLLCKELDTVAAIHSDCKQIMEDFATLTKNHSECTVEKEHLERSLAETREEIAHHQQLLSGLESVKSHLEMSSKKAEEESRDLSMRLNDAMIRHEGCRGVQAQLEMALKTAQEQISALRKELESHNTIEAELEKAKLEIAHIREELAEAVDAHTECDHRLSALTAQLDSSRHEVVIVNEALEAIRITHMECAGERSRLEGELKESLERTKDLQKDAEAVVEVREELHRLREEYTVLEESRATTEHNLKGVSRQLHERESELSQAQRELRDVVKLHAGCDSELSELRVKVELGAKLERDLDTSRREAEQLHQKHQELSDAFTQYKQRVQLSEEELSKTRSNLEQAEKKLITAIEEHAGCSDCIGDLKSELGKLHREADLLREKLNEAAALQKELAKSKRDVETLENSLEEARNNVAEAHRDLQTAVDRHARCDVSKSKLEGALQISKSKFDELQSQLEAVNGELEVARGDFTSKLVDRDTTIKDLREQLRQAVVLHQSNDCAGANTGINTLKLSPSGTKRKAVDVLERSVTSSSRETPDASSSGRKANSQTKRDFVQTSESDDRETFRNSERKHRRVDGTAGGSASMVVSSTSESCSQDYKVVVSLSGFKESNGEWNTALKTRLLKCIRDLGGKFSSTEDYDPHITHIVAPPGTKTLKTFAGLLTHKWIVNDFNWILESAKKGRWLDEKGFKGTRNMSTPFAGKKFFLANSFRQEAVGNKTFRLGYAKKLVALGAGVMMDSPTEADFIVRGGTDTVEYSGLCLDWMRFISLIEGGGVAER